MPTEKIITRVLEDIADALSLIEQHLYMMKCFSAIELTRKLDEPSEFKSDYSFAKECIDTVDDYDL